MYLATVVRLACWSREAAENGQELHNCPAMQVRAGQSRLLVRGRRQRRLRKLAKQRIGSFGARGVPCRSMANLWEDNRRRMHCRASGV